MEYNIYCDESCHLKYTDKTVMMLGSILCTKINRKRICRDIDEIKNRHNLPKEFEIKWTKVGNKKTDFYLEILQYFFFQTNLKYNGLLIQNKEYFINLSMDNDDYNLWYYKFYYILIDQIVMPNNEYFIYIDIKDTKGGEKIRSLKTALCSNKYDYKNEAIKNIQLVDSEESNILQLVDFITGAITFYNKCYDIIFDDQVVDLNEAKVKIVKELIKYSQINLLETSYSKNSNFNLFVVKNVE